MNSGSAAMTTAPRFPDLQHHFDAGQAAEQVSRLATDIGCAVECVSFVLRELSTCHRPGKLLPLIDLLHRLSLSSNASLTLAVQRLQNEIIRALQLSVPQIPEHQQQQLDALRQRWLDAVQGRSKSGELFLRDVARWLTGVGNVRRSEQSRNRQNAVPRQTVELLPPPPPHHPPPPPPPPRLVPSHSRPSSSVPFRSAKDSPDLPFATHQHQKQQNPLQQHFVAAAPLQLLDSQPAEPHQLTQHLQSLSLAPSRQADKLGSGASGRQPGLQQGNGRPAQPAALPVQAIALRPQTEQPQEPFAWVASANLRQVRQRLGELRQVRAVLHQEERLLHARRQELDPTSGRPLKIFCWCGKDLPTWVLGDTYCGRERPGEPRGHKLCITFMQCTECKCKRAIALDAPSNDCWCPKQWQCPGCNKELHGATCSKAGSAIVVVH
ncbi:TPA: hypothetical protein ACH3X3_013468 [Trebouxia sp. C0006]